MYRTIATTLLTIALLFVNDYNLKNVEGQSRLDVPQPNPLILRDTTRDTTIIQPIVENIDMAKEYQYVRTIKVYYKDRMPKPIDLKKGPPVDGYCSDATRLTLITDRNDTISRVSEQRLSCRILAIINFETEDMDKLKASPVKQIRVYNDITENTYIYDIHTTYFQKVIP
jgi:hypothetical protein